MPLSVPPNVPDPVFLLAGGPGQGAATLAPFLIPKLAPLQREHDLVFVDVRGTGGSGPLMCKVEDYGDLDMMLGSVPLTGNIGVQAVHTDQSSQGTAGINATPRPERERVSRRPN